MELHEILDKRLKNGGRIDLALSLDDPVVTGWIADPAMYPNRYKWKATFLWGSTRSPMGNDQVAYLIWHNECVKKGWVLTRARMFREHPHP